EGTASCERVAHSGALEREAVESTLVGDSGFQASETESTALMDSDSRGTGIVSHESSGSRLDRSGCAGASAADVSVGKDDAPLPGDVDSPFGSSFIHCSIGRPAPEV